MFLVWVRLMKMINFTKTIRVTFMALLTGYAFFRSIIFVNGIIAPEPEILEIVADGFDAGSSLFFVLYDLMSDYNTQNTINETKT
jgi:hypothetical protein